MIIGWLILGNYENATLNINIKLQIKVYMYRLSQLWLSIARCTRRTSQIADYNLPQLNITLVMTPISIVTIIPLSFTHIYEISNNDLNPELHNKKKSEISPSRKYRCPKRKIH